MRRECIECGKIFEAEHGGKKLCGTVLWKQGCSWVRYKRQKKTWRKTPAGRKSQYKYFVAWQKKNKEHIGILQKRWRERNPDYWKPQWEKRKAEKVAPNNK